jgi:hypothetical protein
MAAIFLMVFVVIVGLVFINNKKELICGCKDRELFGKVKEKVNTREKSKTATLWRWPFSQLCWVKVLKSFCDCGKHEDSVA